MMDRKKISEHLAQAERHVQEGQAHVARQRARVAELERDGHDATVARQLLQQFEEIQAMHIADRDRLVKELAAARN